MFRKYFDSIISYITLRKVFYLLVLYSMMKITRVNNTQYNSANFKGAAPARKLQEATSKYFSKFEQVGEGVNIALDFIGKAILVPAVIMLASKEDKEKKSYSAIKNPIGATASLLVEAPLLMLGSKYIGKLANDGKLDVKNSGFSYNEKFATDNFIKAAKNIAENDKSFKENSKELLKKIETSGFSNNMKDDFDDLILNFGKDKAENLIKSFKNMSLAHNRLYHLQNRLCFAAALILTPVICGFENFMLPRVMKLIGKNKNPQGTKIQQTERASDINHINNNLNSINAPWSTVKTEEAKCQA